jgi:hypothetical protein
VFSRSGTQHLAAVLGVRGTVSQVKTRVVFVGVALSLSLASAPAIALPAPGPASFGGAGVAEVAPTLRPAPTAGPSVPRPDAVLRHLELLQIEAAIASFLRTPTTTKDRETRQDALSRIGISTGDDLRRVAARVREASALVQAAPTTAAIDPSVQVFQRARRVLLAVFPAAPSWLSSSEMATVLDAAATMHDRAAVRAAFEEMNALVAEGVFLPHVLPAKDLHPLAGPAREVTWASFPATLRRYETLRQEHLAALEELAASTLGLLDGPGALPSAAELAQVWARAGFRRLSALVTGLEQIGDRYRFGARGPESFDCSGFTSYAWAAAGVSLKTYSFSQRAQTDPVPRVSELRPGDLVFYERPSRSGEGLSGHVSMSLGWSDLILEANQGAGQVRVSRFDTDPLWGFGRIRLAEERTGSFLL